MFKDLGIINSSDNWKRRVRAGKRGGQVTYLNLATAAGYWVGGGALAIAWGGSGHDEGHVVYLILTDEVGFLTPEVLQRDKGDRYEWRNKCNTLNTHTRRIYYALKQCFYTMVKGDTLWQKNMTNIVCMCLSVHVCVCFRSSLCTCQLNQTPNPFCCTHPQSVYLFMYKSISLCTWIFLSVQVPYLYLRSK